MKTSVLKKAAFVGIGILATAVVACSSGASSSDAGSETDFTDVPLYESAITQIRRVLTFNREVINATINYDDGNFSLGLIVDCAITDERVVKSLGTNFVRQVKIFSPDPRPRGSQIGTGDHDYLIDVSCGDGGDVAKGAKVSNAFEITWQPGSESQR